MNRLETTLRRCRQEGRKALVPFLTGGYPDAETFLDLLLAVQEAGADALEVGVPFSDPSADGPVIQTTSERALRAGATVTGLLDMLREARRRGLSIPVLFMTYYNPVLAFGGTEFAREAREAGADGVLIVDLPPEEAEEFAPFARAEGLATISLAAPTTPDARLPKLLSGCSGFVYCVSVTGVTGEKRPEARGVGDLVARVRGRTDLPVLVGFGIEDGRTARAMAAVSDGVIVGSALLRRLVDRSGSEAVETAAAFVRELRQALDERSCESPASSFG